MRIRFAIILCVLGLFVPSVAQAQKIEVAPGVTVTRKTYPVPSNEAPFFNFVEKSEAQKAADERLIAGVLQQGYDRAKAANSAIVSGSRAFMQDRDITTAAKRFNQAYLLDPQQSGIYHGFAMVVADRFRDFEYADELFQVAARTKSPAASLSADHGRMFLIAGRPADAVPLLKKGVFDAPDLAMPRMNLAWAVLMSGDKDEACRLKAQVKGQGLENLIQDLEMFQQKANC